MIYVVTAEHRRKGSIRPEFSWKYRKASEPTLPSAVSMAQPGNKKVISKFQPSRRILFSRSFDLVSAATKRRTQKTRLQSPGCHSPIQPLLASVQISHDADDRSHLVFASDIVASDTGSLALSSTLDSVALVCDPIKKCHYREFLPHLSNRTSP